MKQGELQLRYAKCNELLEMLYEAITKFSGSARFEIDSHIIDRMLLNKNAQHSQYNNIYGYYLFYGKSTYC